MVACSSASVPAAAPAIGVTLNEWEIGLDAGEIPAGTTEVHADNIGVLQHELVLIRVEDDDVSLTTTNGVADLAPLGDGLIGELADLSPGATGAVSVDLSPGRYVVLCNIPGHYGAGMTAP